MLKFQVKLMIFMVAFLNNYGEFKFLFFCCKKYDKNCFCMKIKIKPEIFKNCLVIILDWNYFLFRYNSSWMKKKEFIIIRNFATSLSFPFYFHEVAKTYKRKIEKWKSTFLYKENIIAICLRYNIVAILYHSLSSVFFVILYFELLF